MEQKSEGTIVPKRTKGPEKKAAKKKVSKKKLPKKKASKKIVKTTSALPNYPRHAVDKALRIPNAILDQNAGKPCSVKESASYLGVGAAGPYQVEVSSGIKYGFLERPEAGLIAVTDRAKKNLTSTKCPGQARWNSRSCT